MKRNIVVTGGAGYIGSHTVHLLLEQGYDVTVIDNLTRGQRHAVDSGRLRTIDLNETEALRRVFAGQPCDAVIHFAAYIAVGESMRVPELYFANNVAGSLSLLTAMVASGGGFAQAGLLKAFQQGIQERGTKLDAATVAWGQRIVPPLTPRPADPEMAARLGLPVA